MLESYQKPIDRKSIIRCRVCGKEFLKGPMKLSWAQCPECDTVDSLVYLFEGSQKEDVPTHAGDYCKTVEVPRCGNSRCDGTCKDEECVGIERNRGIEKSCKIPIPFLLGLAAGAIIHYLVRMI